MKGRDHVEGLGLGGKLLLKWILKKWELRASYCLFGFRTQCLCFRGISERWFAARTRRVGSKEMLPGSWILLNQDGLSLQSSYLFNIQSSLLKSLGCGAVSLGDMFPTFRKILLLSSTGSSKKMDGIWNRYNLKSTGRIYTFGILKCSEKFKVLDLP